MWFILLGLICTKKNYTHRMDMDTDADEVEYMTVDVGDEEHQHQLPNNCLCPLNVVNIGS